MPEVTSCPSCARQLRVPDTLLGKAVKCPSCGTNFTAGGSATVPTHQPPPPPPPQYQPPPPPTGGYEEPPPQDDADYEDTPRRSRRRRRRSRGSRGAPHRGGLILALGIIGLAMLFASCGLLTLPLCLPAWLMGNRDLRQMEDGYMDQDGEGITQAGRICGLIGTIIGGLAALGYCFYFMFVVVILIGQGMR